MARGALAACIVLLSSALAGCAVFEDGGGVQGSLVRIVVLSFDPEGMEEANDAADVFAALGETTFEYTHDDPSVPAADVTVEYVDESGREREVPLADFTTSDTVGRGDKVTIDGALLTSAVRIRHGDDTLASRGGRALAWMEAGGYPLPVAMDGGLAVWDVAGKLELDAAMDRLEVVEEGTSGEYVCEEPAPGEPYSGDCTYEDRPYRDSFRLSDGMADADADLDAKLTLDAIGSDSAPALKFGLDGTWDMGAVFNIHVEEDSTREGSEPTDADFGFEVDLTAEGDGSVTLRFGSDGTLRSGGAEGDLDVEGSMTVWDAEHTRAEGFSPMGLDDIDFHAPYDEEDLDLDDNPVAFVAAALSDLWRMDLAVGDEFHLSSGDRFGEDVPVAKVTVRVTEKDDKTVPAGTFSALRVETTSVLEVPVDGQAPERFEMPTLVTWIDAKSGIPVAVKQTLAYDYDQEDFAPLFGIAEDLDDGLTITPPDDLHIGLDGQTLMELEEWKEGLHMAPLAAILVPMAAFASPLASAFAFPLFGFGMGGFDEGSAYESAPNVAFSIDEQQDTLIVIKTDPGLSYWEFQFRTSQPLLFENNGEPTSTSELVADDYRYMSSDPSQEFAPGDVIGFCSPGAATATDTVLTVTHVPTNTILYESTLQSVAVCP